MIDGYRSHWYDGFMRANGVVSASLPWKSDAMKGSMLPAGMDWSAPTISMRSWRERLEVEGYLSAVG